MKFKADPKESSGGGNYLRMKDGDSFKVVLQGDPYEFSTLWEQGKSRVVPDGTPKASFRFRINAVLKEDGKYVAKIWEQGARVYKALKALADDYDLSQTVLKVTRSGSTKDDTSYAVVPMPGGVDSNVQREITKIKLHDLVDKSNGAADEALFNEDPMPDEGDIPF